MTVFLDAREMTTHSRAHDHLSAQLQLPEYYGRNLDALYDILTERSEPLYITLSNKEFLDTYGIRIVQTILDAASHNSGIFFMEKD